MDQRVAWEGHPNIGGLAGTLLYIHDSFRETSAALVALADATGTDVLARMRRLFRPLAQTLHHHHHAEEQMLFPLVREHTAVHPAALVEDHHALMALLAAVETALARDDHMAADLAALVRRLDDALRDHLAREEAIAVPVLLALTPEQATRFFYAPR
jgi:iron-sulfur cluster repair protein YtfE (RIC family)